MLSRRAPAIVNAKLHDRQHHAQLFTIIRRINEAEPSTAPNQLRTRAFAVILSACSSA
jgi:hypothetical protein